MRLHARMVLDVRGGAQVRYVALAVHKEATMSVTTTAPRTSVRYPARLTNDVRIAVTIEEPSTPFPIVVYFLDIYEKENPATRALIAVGIELRPAVPPRQA